MGQGDEQCGFLRLFMIGSIENLGLLRSKSSEKILGLLRSAFSIENSGLLRSLFSKGSS